MFNFLDYEISWERGFSKQHHGVDLFLPEVNTGGVCAADARYQREVVIPLTSCEKDITNHIRSVGVSDIQSEIELICARASIFKIPRNISSWTICPAHRSSLGIGWRRGANRCWVPGGISVHGSKGKPRKANRGIGMTESKAILKRTGVFIPKNHAILIAKAMFWSRKIERYLLWYRTK